MNGGLVLVVGWMTHCVLVDDPPYDPQYGVEHLASRSLFGKWFFRGLVAPVCHSLGDGLVLKAIMACLTKKYRYLWPMCFFFSSVPFFLILHASSMLPVCSMM